MQEEVFLNFYEVVYSYYVNKKTVKIGNIDFLVSKIDLERTNKFEALIGNEVNLQKVEKGFLSPNKLKNLLPFKPRFPNTPRSKFGYGP